MKTLNKDQRGIAQVVLLVLVLVVVAVGGYGAWRVLDNKNNKTDSSSATPAPSNTEAQDACNNLYKDADLCKFASNDALVSAAYKANFTITDKDGKITSFESEQDGKGNSSVINKENGVETSAFILLDGDNYVKNVADGS